MLKAAGNPNGSFYNTKFIYLFFSFIYLIILTLDWSDDGKGRTKGSKKGMAL